MNVEVKKNIAKIMVSVLIFASIILFSNELYWMMFILIGTAINISIGYIGHENKYEIKVKNITELSEIKLNLDIYAYVLLSIGNLMILAGLIGDIIF